MSYVTVDNALFYVAFTTNSPGEASVVFSVTWHGPESNNNTICTRDQRSVWLTRSTPTLYMNTGICMGRNKLEAVTWIIY